MSKGRIGVTQSVCLIQHQHAGYKTERVCGEDDASGAESRWKLSLCRAPCRTRAQRLAEAATAPMAPACVTAPEPKFREWTYVSVKLLYFFYNRSELLRRVFTILCRSNRDKFVV
ncbi:uncharacterized [Tachysurus ichikawai]